MKVLLVGIAGTSHDILLAPYVLKAYADANLLRPTTIEVLHYPYILPSELERHCDDILDNIEPDVMMQWPDILIGFSVYTWNADAVMYLAQQLKNDWPEIGMMFGGPELSSTNADKWERYGRVIIGEGEIALLNLLRGSDEAAEVDIARAPSSYLSGAIPDALLAQPDICANIETQRGCNFRCAYCQYHAGFPSIRYRDMNTVIDEIQYAYDKGVRHFRFTDANFLSDKKRADRIMLALIKRQIHASLFFEAIPSFVGPVIADLIHEYQNLSPDNKVMVGIGLQTINAESLKVIKRNLPLSHFTRAFDLLRRAGAIIKIDIILGLPHETLESYLQLMDYIGDVMRNGYNSLAISILRILPNSDLEQVAKESGIVVAEGSEHFVYETPTMPRSDMVMAECISAVAVRLFSVQDNLGKLSLRNAYFETKDRLGVNHSLLLMRLSLFFSRYLAEHEIDADYNTSDFPNAEHCWYFDLPKQIPDEAIESELRRWSN